MEKQFSEVLQQINEAINKAEDADLTEHKIIMGRIAHVKQHIAELLNVVADLEKKITHSVKTDDDMESDSSTLTQGMLTNEDSILDLKKKSEDVESRSNKLFGEVQRKLVGQ